MKQIIPFCLTLTFSGLVQGMDGALDPSYATDAEFPGYGIHLGLNSDLLAYNLLTEVLAAPDGKHYLIGSMADPQNNSRLSIIRTQPNGPRDQGFGDGGLRTYPMPCNASRPSDAAIDAKGRIWVAFAACNDVRLHRFDENGNLDTSLQDVGYVSVDFPEGQANGSVRIAVDPANGIVVAAGVTSGGEDPRLALGRYDQDGNPVAFGVGGVSQLPLDNSVKRLTNIHVMQGGGVTVDGSLGAGHKVFVARVLPNGAPDAGFGNVSPGLSVADFWSLLVTPFEAPELNDSILNPDGSLLQFGHRVRSGTESNRDFMIVRWRPDGLLDTSIGAHGHRAYALDLGGPNPEVPGTNWDFGHTIARQGDGKYLLVGRTMIQDEGFATGITTLRLERDLSIDTSFGDGGKSMHWLDMGPGENSMTPVDISLVPGRILIGASTRNAEYWNYQVLLALSNDLLFADTFD